MMRDTIRHDNTGRSIACYLAAVDAVRGRQDIVRYMALMHATSPECVDSSLRFLIRAGTIERVSSGRYRCRWEIIA